MFERIEAGADEGIGLTVTSQDLRRRLAAGEALVGTFVATPSAEIVEMLGLAGLDFCVLDMEHAHFGTETLAHLLRAAELRDMATIVRIPASAPALIGIVLDLGACGVMIPGISTADEAARLLSLMRYPPAGTRGAHLSTRHLRYSVTPFATAAEPDSRPLTVLQIERPLDAQVVRDIVASDGLDVAFVGVNDLAQSLGHPGDVDHPKVQAVVQQIVVGARQRAAALGMWVRTPEELGRMRTRGFRFLTVSNNELMFYEAARSLVLRAEASLDLAEREA